MAAVLGLATEQVRPACGDASGRMAIAVAANINAPDQTVISGDPAGGRARRRAAAKALGARRVVPLKVSGAFHSPLMAPAVDGLHEALAASRASGARVSGRRQRERAKPVTTGADAARLLSIS